MTDFAPIAIVGRACLLPGARSAADLFELAAAGRGAIGDVPQSAGAHRWRLPEAHVMTDITDAADPRTRDHSWTRRGGYVTEPDAAAFFAGLGGEARASLAQESARGEAPLGELHRWVHGVAWQAVADVEGPSLAPERTFAVLGNLSLPSSGSSAYAERAWLGPLADRAGIGAVHPADRLNSAGPITRWLASFRALAGERRPHDPFGAHLGGYALDAACASSLYALQNGCRALQSGHADHAVVGAVNRADDLFIHVGFSALGAMSRTGQSRPFHAQADGLVPGEGCAFVVLERLEDAVRAGRVIHGVIRGVGLANDGRAKNLLAPSERGQVRSMRLAFAQCGIDPAHVPYVECHATGTPIGDGTELRSMREVYAGGAHIGSLKGNIGHLITASGMAGLLKVLESMERRTLLPTPHLSDQPRNDALAASAFRVLEQCAPWQGPRRAGLSAFGFGGNDAHLLVEHLEEAPRQAVTLRVPAAVTQRSPIAVVGLGAHVGDARSAAQWDAVLRGEATLGAATTVRLPLRQLKFPPNDLKMANGHQTLVLAAALEATAQLELPRERTGVYVGYTCDPQIARWGARWRTRVWGEALGADPAWVDATEDMFAPPLEAAHVVGCLPNIPANRLSSQLDLQGPSHTVSAHAHSGIQALRLAIEALRDGTLDAAIVGAVAIPDASLDPEVAEPTGEPSHSAREAAAVVLVLRRGGAEAGADALAEVDLVRQCRSTPADAANGASPPSPGATDGLLEVAAAVLDVWRVRGQEDRELATPSGVRVRSPSVAANDTAVKNTAAKNTAAADTAAKNTAAADIAAKSTEATTTRKAPTGSLDNTVMDGGSTVARRRGVFPSSEVSGPVLELPIFKPPVMVRAPSLRPRDPIALDKPRAAGHPSAPPRVPAPSVPLSVEVSSHMSRPSPSAQRMAPAPPLPPVSFDGPVAAPRTATQMGLRSQRAPSAPAAIEEPPLAAMTGTAPGPTVAPMERSAPSAAELKSHEAVSGPPALAALVRHQEALAHAHSAFVAQQSALHAQLLQTMARLPWQTPVHSTTPPPSLSASARSVSALDAPADPQQAESQQALPAPSPPPAATVTPSAFPHAPLQPSPAVAPRPAVQRNAEPSAATSHRMRTESASPLPTSAALAHSTAELPLAFRPRGPSFTREDLRVHAGGLISTLFGDRFREQDGHAVQVRMPEPPLLLADRCTGIDAEPGAMADPNRAASAKGICWTETDVRADSWYLHDGYMPTGIMVESGQADLFLISYLGADFLNRGERAYRLLGCEMTWLGDLPTIGESLVYDIHVDGHAAQGDVRLFFFHYDCHVRRADGTIRPALQVRHGQAGFFTTEELAASAGILWRAEQQQILADARLDEPAVSSVRGSYESKDIQAFAEGRPWECFGDAFARTRTHTRTPRIQSGRMLFLDRVETLDPRGGPWGRGYLKAVTPIAPEDWFFEGHFKNDPCMPGTLMLEGCVQALAFYLTAMGYTVDKDGWRFQPIPQETYSLRCRGQVTPTSRELTYEIFVEEIHDGPEPMLYADLLCTVDGLGAFHARRFGLKLTPSWPLTSRPTLTAEGKGDPRAAVASYRGSQPFRFDRPSLVACAWGQPSTAFGPMYERFDEVRRTPRLPGPPYLFLSRVTQVDGDMGELQSGKRLEFEYDIPEDAWYFGENGARVMPFAVLLEAALQPCGWTASYVGCTLTSDKDFLFRNLDGKGTIKTEVFPHSGTLRTTVDIKGISRSAGMIITSFEVHCYLGDTEVYELDTVFGFFPPEAFVDQAGLPTSVEQRSSFDAPRGEVTELADRPSRYFDGTLRLAAPMLLMINRLTRMEPDGGSAGLGVARADKDVDASEWFFKAHFYQDPVQPGSLGIEAMLQLLQALMIDKDLGSSYTAPRFEAIATDLPHVWKYRGQVVPEAKRVTTTVEITSLETDPKGTHALADASLWVDGKRIYEARGLGMRIVEDRAERPDEPLDEEGAEGSGPSESAAMHGSTDPLGGSPEETLELSSSAWLEDHCPTYTRPALPMMSMVDRMLAAARERDPSVDGLHDVRVQRWVVVDPIAKLRTEIVGDEVRLLVWREARTAELSRYEVAAKANIGAPLELEPIGELQEIGDPLEPYADDRLFHGPAFHYVRELRLGNAGSTALLDAAGGSVPYGSVHQGLLDAATHGIPHDRLDQWSDAITDAWVGYPHALDLQLRKDPPREGRVRCETRFVGFEDDDSRRPVFRIQLSQSQSQSQLHASSEEPWEMFAELRLVEILLPKGPLGMADPTERRRFLQDRREAHVGLSRCVGGVTYLDPEDVARSDWFPGTLTSVYGSRDPRSIAIQEHVGRLAGVHPGFVQARDDSGVDRHRPLRAYPLDVRVGNSIRVADAGSMRMDLSAVMEFWRTHFAVGPWPVEDLYFGLIERFVADFHVADPHAMQALEGKAVLYLGNHQVGIESLLFSVVASALQRVPTLTLAKVEHQQSWLGQLITQCFAYPGITDPGVITYFDRADPSSLPRIAKELASQVSARSLMVHVEGTRAHSARHRVSKMSGIFCELAIMADVPIVPVRFSGGLPVATVAEKLEYPVGMGRQDYWMGAPITPYELATLPYKERIDRVIAAIGSLGPDPDEELPNAPDLTFEQKVRTRARRLATLPELAAWIEVLDRPGASPGARALFERVVEGPDAEASSLAPVDQWTSRLAAMLRGFDA